MAYYTDLTKIKAMFRDIKIETSGTAIIKSEVNQWIDEAEAEIHAKIDPYYDTPVDETTSPKSFLILTKIATYKVAHVIKTVLELDKQTSDKVQEVQTNLDKKADKILSDILPTFDKGRLINPIMPLPDAVSKFYAPKTASIFSTSSNDPIFTKNGDNW